VGVSPSWQEDFFSAVQEINYQLKYLSFENYHVISFEAPLVVHLVPLENNFEPAALIALQNSFAQENKLLVHLWEDVWLAKRKQVLGRIKSFLGLNKGLYGRKAKIVILSKKQTKDFLTDHHLHGFARAKYNFGLTIDDNIIAAACFSEARPMKAKGETYKSAELVRFASKQGITVIGGLSKLIKNFTKQVKINDLMTYADRDWSLGKGYDTLGFDLSSITPPTYLYVNIKTLDRHFPHRLPKEIMLAHAAQNILNLDDFLMLNGFMKVFNTGNLKYHLIYNV
jgi:hypothetical protein